MLLSILNSRHRFGDFVSLWQTTTANETITLPTPTNYRVDWGDGTVTTNTNSHEYLTANQYTIKINGEITDFVFNNGGDKEKILDIPEIGGVKNLLDNTFYGCLNLENVSGKTNLVSGVRIFQDNSNLISLPDLDCSQATTMFSFLFGCTVFNQPLILNTENAWNMTLMLAYCENFNSTVNIDTSSVTSMSQFIRNCPKFNQPLNLNTSKVTNMFAFFFACEDFNQPIFFDFGEVLDISSFLQSCMSFNQPMTLNTAKAVNMKLLFSNCIALNQALNIDSSNAEDMGSLFFGCTVFNQPLTLNTAKAKDMSFMFRSALAFNQDVSSWSFVSVKDMNGFMQNKGAEYDVNYMDNLYIKLDQDLVFANMVNVNISFGSINYTSAGAPYRASLISKGFIITSGNEI